MSFYNPQTDWDALIASAGTLTLDQVAAASGVDKEKIIYAIARNKLRANKCYQVNGSKMVVILDIVGDDVQLTGGE